MWSLECMQKRRREGAVRNRAAGWYAARHLVPCRTLLCPNWVCSQSCFTAVGSTPSSGYHSHNELGFPGGSDGKESSYKAEEPGSILGLGRSPGEGNGNPHLYSCLENSMDRGAWWATAHWVAKSRLSH